MIFGTIQYIKFTFMWCSLFVREKIKKLGNNCILESCLTPVELDTEWI